MAQRMPHNEVRLELREAGFLLFVVLVVLEPISLLVCGVVIVERRGE